MEFLVRPNCYHGGLLRLGLAQVLLVYLLACCSTKVLVQGRRLADPLSLDHGRSSALSQRQLQSDVDYFEPQGCTLGPCQPWTTLFGSAATYSNRIIIDCTVCVTMDHTNFRLDDGMEVRGRLVVPEGTSLAMETTFLVVQGELDITATQPVNGSPPVSITLFGDNDDQAFSFPTDPSQCTFDSMGCTIGQKGIVVAGGKLNGKWIKPEDAQLAHFDFSVALLVQGLPLNAPTWVPLHDVKGGTFNNPETIVVSSSVASSWAVGAEILVTSHTREWDEQTTRTITAVRTAGALSELDLDAPIVRPTTAVESADFAVEVALLSRNIVFRADSLADVGGHLEFRRTVASDQTLDGVDIQHFGQPGVLGRYPVHTHFCGSLSGSVISRNTIRHSKQRCIVVHGTDDLVVRENVAFDTAGHCFMTEDGIETGNSFINNLGALTSPAIELLPDNTDDEPATFWIPNPTNSFVGNVAAGSQDSGFWFDARIRGSRAHLFTHLNPINDPLIAFENNVAHSNGARLGAIRTYTPGYMPTSEVVFSGLRVYRNGRFGIHLHKCHNIIVRNSIFADNANGLDIDRAEAITVEDVVIIGESPSFRAIMSREPNVSSPCRNHRLIGLDLHTWKLHKQFGGATLRNIHISGFTNTACPRSYAIYIDGLNLRQGQFEEYTSFEDITVEDGEEKIDFCEAGAKGVTALYLVDNDGSLSGGTSNGSKPSVLIGDNPLMTRFVGEAACSEISTGCYSYCPGVCMRSYRYVLDPEGTENFGLRVCRTDSPSDCATFPGSRRGEREPRTFIGHMPTGNDYVAYFVDGSGGFVDLPPITEEQYEANLCGSDTYSVSLVDALATSNPSLAPTTTPSDTPTTTPSEQMVTSSPSVISNAPSASPSRKPSSAPILTPGPTPSPSRIFLLSTEAPSIAPSDSSVEPSLKPVLMPYPTSTPARNPTLRPVPIPVTVPEIVPVQGEQNTGSPNCFSGKNEVVVKGRGVTLMKDIRAGDYVLSQGDSFSRVYSLAHMDQEKTLAYLRISFREGGRVEISDRHYIQVNGSFSTADLVQPGDVMVGSGSIQKTVSSVDRVEAQGLFAPLTESGTMVVGGVLVSNYVALLDTTVVDEHTFIHMVVSPVRMACRICPSFCANETHSSSGISTIFVPAITLASRIQRLNRWLQWLTSLLVFPVLLSCWAIDRCSALVNLSFCNAAIFAVTLLALRTVRRS